MSEEIKILAESNDTLQEEVTVARNECDAAPSESRAAPHAGLAEKSSRERRGE